MLKGIPPMLGPELLRHLRAMGHGDEVAVVDANFPAESSARRLIRLDGCSATSVLDAVLKVMPLDTYVDDAIHVMHIVGTQDFAPITDEFRASVAQFSQEVPAKVAGLERFAFYERASKAYLVISTGEDRLYGNIILKKGILPPGKN